MKTRHTRAAFALTAALALTRITRLAQAAAGVPDPLLLPVATTAQVPLTAAYNALNVPSLAAGGSYLDPTTRVKIYKLTSGVFPTSSLNWGHDYAEGGDEVSLPYNGNTRAVIVRQNGGPWWLIDFTPGGGVSNPRPLTGVLAPFMDVAFAFSNNPATPYYAYVSSGSTIRRFDIRTMAEAPGNGWPVTGESSAMWLHQAENDSFFVWMRGANGSTIVGYEPGTGITKTYTNANLNEPRIDRAGRYVGVSMDIPGNGLIVWDWLTNTIPWTTPGDPGIPFSHNASLRRRWLSVDWNMSYPPDYTMFTPDVPNSAVHIAGPANATLVHGNGNWIQHPADPNDQWALFCHYGSLRPAESFWLAPGGFVLITPNGQRRLLGHPYNTTGNYTFYTFAKFSPDGRYVLFTSDMNGSGRSDVFLAELPVSASTPDTTPPAVSIAAPAAGSTVSGAAANVSANASDDVGVAGVQFLLDGGNLGAEDTAAPFAVSWNTTTAVNGSHSLSAVARDAAGNIANAAAVTVTVSNVVDASPPVLSGVAVSEMTSSAAIVVWTTDEPADSQVEYGRTTAYGSSAVLDPSLVLSHSQSLGGLSADTAYHFRVRSHDAAGNLAVSPDSTFTTLALPGPIASWKLDEGSGLTAADASGNANTGSLVNGVAWTAGRAGQAVALDGVDDYVRVPHAAMLDAFPLSVAAWFKTTSSVGVRGLVNKYVANAYDGYQIFFEDGGLCAWYLRDTANYVYDGTGCTMKTFGYNDGAWHHVVFVVDAAGGRLYLDGAQKGAQPWTGAAGAPTTLQELHLGHYPGAQGGAEYLGGLIDEVRIYDRALSGAEVSQLFTEPPPVSDATPPAISAVNATGIGGATATITWVTDETADSQVEYGTTTAYGASTVLDPALLTAHSERLAGLAPSTLYHYRVRSTDAAGNAAVSGDFTLRTLDTVPPAVSITVPLAGQGVSGIVTVAASASDDVGVAGVQFKVDGAALGAEVTAAPYTTAWDTRTAANGSHTLTAVARDGAGNATTSAAVAVIVGNSDFTPPVISGVAASGITSAGATVTWATDEPADSQVEYGTTTAYGASTAVDPAAVVTHSQPLANLAAATLYHYRVRSRDAAGNLAVSGDSTFTTAALPVPIAYWKLDEGAGTKAGDSSGNGNTGTLLNGPVWTAGRSGKALSFDGINDYVRVPHAAMLDAYPLTVVAWFKTTSTAGVRGLVNKYVANSYNGYQIFFENGSLCAWYLRTTSNYIYDGTGCTMRTPGYNDGQWHQVALVVDGAGARLYVDAVEKRSLGWTGPPGPATTTRELALGFYPGAAGGAKYLAGTVDAVRIYNKALTPDQILQLFNAVQ
jgi:hypothetical protein